MGKSDKEVVKVLNENSSLFSKLVAKELRTKYSPKLSFFSDYSFSQADKINELINSKKKLLIMNGNESGWINIYKEEGITSLSISKALKKKFKFKKLGHLGTLDPLAEGVLPIAVGEATKSIKFITNNKKKYTFIIKWGEETDTCDREGKIISKSKKRPSYEDIKFIIKKFFTGKIDQIPPLFSAVKVNGKRAYKLARKDLDIKLKKNINILNIEQIN